MNVVLDAITFLMNGIGRVLFVTGGFLSPALTLLLISQVLAIGMLYLWRYTSNQDAIAAGRRKISAYLMATLLFKDNLRVMFRSQRVILWETLRVLGYSVPPMIVMLIPFALIVAQIGLRYEFDMAPTGRTINVLAQLKSPDGLDKGGDQLSLPDGVRSAPLDPVRAAPIGTVTWRLTADNPGVYTLKFGDGDDVVEMPLAVGDGFQRISAVRGGGVLTRLMYSALPSIPADSVFKEIRIDYPKRSTSLFGFDWHWLIWVLVLSIVFGFLWKPVLNVQI